MSKASLIARSENASPLAARLEVIYFEHLPTSTEWVISRKLFTLKPDQKARAQQYSNKLVSSSSQNVFAVDCTQWKPQWPLRRPLETYGVPLRIELWCCSTVIISTCCWETCSRNSLRDGFKAGRNKLGWWRKHLEIRKRDAGGIRGGWTLNNGSSRATTELVRCWLCTGDYDEDLT